MTTEAPATRRPRSDAERNRRRILDAASRVFAAHGPAATLSDVAAEAGVGIGTIYRKFPDKAALLDALFDDKIGAVMAVLDAASAIAHPGEAFRDYLSGMIELHARDRSLATVLFGPDRFDRFPADVSDRLSAGADALIRDAVAAGEVREGFTRQDTIALGVMVGTLAVASRDSGLELWRRYASIVVAGTRPSASPAPLLPQPLGFREMAESLSRVL
ncbi:helix-turn-helix domain-containing protein [Microbacterium sp. LS_15]|uniref:TetR/AcrR family transcriptional regulator n=1 Tax=Microbacterium sp. LS_15 TaxID=3055790 RepID=UPI0035BED48B